MRAYERLLKYVTFPTGSDENEASCPSTVSQRVFGEYLVAELKSLGALDVRLDENGYVYARIPATRQVAWQSKIGFIAHMDTVSDVKYTDVKPRIIENYDGDHIMLNKEKGIVMQAMPELTGSTLIVTDGTTILGADDKAGVAEIMTAAEILLNDKSIDHGEIMIAFTPDEEIGRGADLFDVKGFGADFAYTVDGGRHGQIEYENFNAVNAKVVIKGKSVHPGEAKYGGMRNANSIALEFDSMLPKNERPEYTEGYEGFYHLMEIKSDVESAVLRYILRDHDGTKIKIKRAMLEKIAEFLNVKYGKGTVTLELCDSYANMAEMIEPHMHLITNACSAIEEAGGTVDISPIRGGTDGARLSFMGLPCPNLGTGSSNHHGRFEYAVAEEMDRCVDTIIGIAVRYASPVMPQL